MGKYDVLLQSNNSKEEVDFSKNKYASLLPKKSTSWKERLTGTPTKQYNGTYTANTGIIPVAKEVGRSLFQGTVGTGESLGQSISVNRGDFDALNKANEEKSTIKLNLVKKINDNKKLGRDNTALIKVYNSMSGPDDTIQTLAPATTKSKGQVLGELGLMAAGLLGAGTMSASAKGLGYVGGKVEQAALAKLTAKQLKNNLIKDVALNTGVGYGSDVSRNFADGKTGPGAFKPGLGTVAGFALPGLLGNANMNKILKQQSDARIASKYAQEFKIPDAVPGRFDSVKPAKIINREKVKPQLQLPAPNTKYEGLQKPINMPSRKAIEQGTEIVPNRTYIPDKNIPKIKVENAPKGHSLNIGFNIGDGTRKLTEKQIIKEIKNLGVDIINSEAKQSGTEKTFIPQLSRGLTETELGILAKKLEQDAIAQLSDGVGTLNGPKYKDWGGKFSEEYYLKPIKKKIDFEHYSVKKGLSELDPSFQFTGAKGSEGYLKNYPEFKTNYINLYKKGVKPEQLVLDAGGHKYSGSIDGSFLEVGSKEFKEIGEEARKFIENNEKYSKYDNKAMNAKFIELVKQKGYDGIEAGNAVQYFNKINVAQKNKPTLNLLKKIKDTPTQEIPKEQSFKNSVDEITQKAEQESSNSPLEVDSINLKAEGEKAKSYISTFGKEKARRVAMGIDSAPEGVKSGAIHSELFNAAKKENDYTLMKDLATSDVFKPSAQEINLAKNREPNSFYWAIKDINDTLRKKRNIVSKMNEKSEINNIADKIRKSIEGVQLDDLSIKKLAASLICK